MRLRFGSLVGIPPGSRFRDELEWEARAYLWAIHHLRLMRNEVERSVKTLDKGFSHRANAQYVASSRRMQIGEIRKVIRKVSLINGGTTKGRINDHLTIAEEAMTYAPEALEARQVDAAKRTSIVRLSRSLQSSIS